MEHLLFIFFALALLAGFLALAEFEGRRGVRLFAAVREKLDRQVARAEFIFAHIDLAAFVRDEVRRAASRIGHDIVNGSLQAVRTVERFLARIVRNLRARHSVNVEPRASSRPFVKTLSDFKGRLKATRPEVPEIR